LKPTVRVAFANFWPSFTPDLFRARFPYVYEKYDLALSADPDVVFYSVFPPAHKQTSSWHIPQGNYVRVFITGENAEPDMNMCEFALSFSRLINNPNHLRLPLWVYEARNWGYAPGRLVKSANTDWEEVASQKTEFCNFVYRHDVPFRNAIFSAVNAYKRVDAAGSCMNNMNGWRVPEQPYWQVVKIKFLQRYKFTLAVENAIWPGYSTEKLVDPMYVNSIPIYVGDPMLRRCFNPDSYIDFSQFSFIKEMIERIREIDNNRDLYLKMLTAPFFHDNRVPTLARDETVMAFFDRVFAAALERKPK